MKKTIELLIPCYNEESVINSFIKETNKIIDKISNYNFNFYFINDGSTDNTLNILKDLHKNETNKYNYLSFSRNFGKEAAIYAGLKNTTSDYVILMDADLEHPPELILEFINKIEEGYDQVIARRIHRMDNFFSDKFHAIISLMSKDIQLPTGIVDYRIMSKQVVNSVLQLSETERYSRGFFDWVGFSKTYVTYNNIKNEIRKSNWTFYSLLKYALTAIFTFSDFFLTFIFFMGIMLSLGSLFYLIITILIKSFSIYIFIILLMSGIIETSLGLISLYLKRIYWQTKQRPIYIESENSKK